MLQVATNSTTVQLDCEPEQYFFSKILRDICLERQVKYYVLSLKKLVQEYLQLCVPNRDPPFNT